MHHSRMNSIFIEECDESGDIFHATCVAHKLFKVWEVFSEPIECEALFEENAKALQSVMSLYEDGALCRLLGQPPPRATVAEGAGGAERQVRIGGEMMGAPTCIET